MDYGLSKTIQILTETRNGAALDVLLRAFQPTGDDISRAVLRALVDRRDEAGHFEVLRRWNTLNDDCRKIIVERASRMELAVRAAILSNDLELQRSASELACLAREYDLIPALITAGEDRGNPHALVAARTVLELCERLYDELHTPRDYRDRRDPVLIRQFVYGTLEHAISRYEPHHPQEIVEAFLLLVRPDDAILKQCLLHPHDKIYAPVVNLFTTSPRPVIQKLLMSLLDDSHAPAALGGILSRRKDRPFLHAMFERVNRGITPNLKSNLHRIESFAWLRSDLSFLATLEDSDLRGAVTVVAASNMNRLQVFEVVKYVLQRGGALSRRAASAALAEFRGREANDLALSLLEDADPEVQANGVIQLRDRGIPGVLARIVELVESPHEVVRQAVRQALVEFTFQRYLSTFEMLDAASRRSTGTLVKRVDPHAMEQLTVELTSQSRTRRLRALEVAVAMGAVHEVEKVIIELTQDADHFVRAEAARALTHSPSEATCHALRELLADRSVSVREVAETSLYEIEGMPMAGPTPAAPPLDWPANVENLPREYLP